jgi:dihydroneopterin aldolase
VDKIILKGLQFYGHHGVLPQERELGRRFVVDLELFLDLTEAGRRDDLTCTVDYTKVVQLVEKQVTGSSHRLIEAIADNLASAVLNSFSVEEVKVRVKKIDVPLPGSFEYIAVEISRKR